MTLSFFCRLWENRLARGLVVVLCAVAALAVCILAVERAVWGSSEFRGFRQIVQVSLLQDRNHYEAIAHLRAYPPFFAIYWAPFGLFPPGAPVSPASPLEGVAAWRVAILAGSATLFVLVAVGSTFLCARLAVSAAWQHKEPVPLCAHVLTWMLAASPMLNSVARCESDMIVVMPLAAAMYLMFARKRQFGAGALMGLAAAVKLTPALFGLYLLCQRRWRALAGMACAAILCTVVLPVCVWGPKGAYERHRSWLEKVIIPYARTGPEAFIGRPYRAANQSPTAALHRYLSFYNAGSKDRPRYVNIAFLRPRHVKLITTGVKLMFLSMLVGVWMLSSASKEPREQVLAFALVPVGMLLLSDVSLTSHTAIFVIPYGALTALVLARPHWEASHKLSLGVLAAFTLSSLTAVQYLKMLSTTTAAVLVLFATLCYAVFAVRRRGESTQQGGRMHRVQADKP